MRILHEYYPLIEQKKYNVAIAKIVTACKIKMQNLITESKCICILILEVLHLSINCFNLAVN